MLSHSSEFHSELSDFFLSFEKVLGVKVSIRSDSLVEVLLLFEFTLSLDIFLLQLRNNIIIELDLLKALIIFSVGLGCF